MRLRKPRRPLTILASILPLISITAAIAQAEPAPSPSKDVPVAQVTIEDPVPMGFDSWDSFIEVQNNLDRAADAIHDLASEPGNPGFSSIEIDQANKSLKLYWQGAPPEQISRIADSMPSGYTIRSYPAIYTEATLSSAIQEEAKLLHDSGVSFTSIAPKPDSSGIDVNTPGDPAPALTALKDVAVATEVKSTDLALESQEYIPGPTNPPTVWMGPGRLYDRPLFWGGAKWYTYTAQSGSFPAEMCSTAFAVWQGGKTKLLTAGHCPGNEVFTKAAPGYQIYNHEGYIEQRLLKSGVATPDLELINPDTSGSDGWVWFGGSTPSSDLGDPIGKSESVNVGDFICTDGASSLKVHCAGKVLHTGETVSYGTGETVSDVADAQSIDGTPLSISGDSGGPVLFPCCGPLKWAAQGIISGGGWNGTYHVTVFTPIKVAESKYGAQTIVK